jgi:tellurite resistance protein
MANDDAIGGRRELEEDYFRRQDQELIEKMRKASAADQARRELGAKVGLTDPELLKEIELLGFTPDTVTLLPLIPVIQVAWAEGGVSIRERKLIVELARKRGIEPESAAGRQLDAWLEHSPVSSVFSRATRLIKAMIAAGPEQSAAIDPDDLVKYSESIAAAAGGLLGLGRVSSEERAVLAQIRDALQQRP